MSLNPIVSLYVEIALIQQQLSTIMSNYDLRVSSSEPDSDFKKRAQEKIAKITNGLAHSKVLLGALEEQQMYRFTATQLYVTPEFLQAKYGEMVIAPDKLLKYFGRQFIEADIMMGQQFFKTIAEKEDIFHFHNNGENWTCTIEFGNEVLGQAVANSKEAAKTQAEDNTLQKLCKHPIYFSQFIIQIPDSKPSLPKTAISALQVFINLGGLKGVYRFSEDKKSVRCRLIFGENQLGEGLGSTKAEAGENAAQLTFKYLADRIMVPRGNYFRAIAQEREKNLMGMLSTVIAVGGLVDLVMDYLFVRSTKYFDYNGLKIAYTSLQPEQSRLGKRKVELLNS